MKEIIKNRTKIFALSVWKLCEKLPKSREYNAYCNQLIRSSSSVGANYRAACRAKSAADFINKLKIVEEEADESMFFLELLIEIDCGFLEEIRSIHSEANEIVSIIVASIKTAKNHQSSIKNQKS